MRTLGCFLLAFACSTAFGPLSHARLPFARRAGFAAGLAPIAIVALFGLLWPSPLTIVALACLPCALLFLAGLAWPSLAERRWVRAYGIVALLLSTSSLAYLTWCDFAGEAGRIAHGSRPLLHRTGPRP
jgi:hypothetical protein